MSATQTPGRKRRAYAPRVPVERRRAQLLDAALHLLVTRGHGGVTMESVAEEAGVTKPVVYGLFANRAELLSALLQREHEQALAQLEAILPVDLDGQPPATPADLLGHLVREFLRAVRDAPNRWRCIVMSMPDMPAEFCAAQEQSRKFVLARFEPIAAWLVQSLNAPPALDPEIIAHTGVSLLEMAARLVLTDPDHFYPERLVAALLAVIEGAQIHW